ncbi:hypothetical protein B0A48_16131 [Cryoendolithus antarcticus]|uniref:BTB domain-containing protein n=1 Tax=Cryoendolithus antarcticus TaxID=1507870 RepID=A0A1V8SG52_9PEZI|nr:hypothetical protein B0A48_16131 [Cryoendolithus antarcticus]
MDNETTVPAAEDRTTIAKHNIEKALYQETQDIRAGRLKDENPLDKSADFRLLCDAARRGDLRLAQEQITKGVNTNARDEYDYTPLILASLCGHFELVQMLLEQGAKCERDTFQGERCLYNALNDRIRNLLLSYDYSKSTDPLQPLAGHITSLLTRDAPQTADIILHTADTSFRLHKFVLSARSPYFRRKLQEKPETKSWKLAPLIPTESFECCIRYLYFGDAFIRTLDREDEERSVLEGVDRLSRQLEVPQVFETLLNPGDRRQARQRRQDDVENGRDQLAAWFRGRVLQRKFVIDTDEVSQVTWTRDNPSFADVLLQADVDDESTPPEQESGIPIGPSLDMASRYAKPRKTLFPAHRAMLLRSELFSTMFASSFREGHIAPQTIDWAGRPAPNADDANEALQVVPVDCTAAVLEVILTFLYTENVSFPLSIALDVLHAADMLFIDKLKQRAALLISTLGNGTSSVVESELSRPGSQTPEEQSKEWIYEVIRSGWDCRVHRLEEFGARYLAYRLESYIGEPEFREIVRESAGRITRREETDTVELVDDIRYYLSERLRLRFEDAGLEELMEGHNVRDTREHEEAEDSELDKTTGETNDVNILADAHMNNISGEGQVVRTLDGEIAGDEFAQDAVNYQILLAKIDGLLEELRLDA